MKRFGYFLSFLTLFLSIFFCCAVKAEEATTTTTTTSKTPDGSITKIVETRKTITTPVPQPKEVIATPSGFISCFTVDAGWVGDTWIPAHRVCQYDNTGEGVAYVEGYWACNQSTADGVCTNWQWKPGRWEKTLVTY